MKRFFIKIVAIGVLLVMISGCAGMNDSTRTKAEGTGLGALLGAGLGAGIGALAGGGKGAAIGAGIGAVVGGAGGYMFGSSVADRKQKYANEEDRLDGEINYVAKENSDLREYNQKTTARINDLNQQIADLKHRYHEGNVQVSALKKKQDQINGMIQETDKRRDYYSKELADLNDYRQSIAQTQDQGKVAKLAKEIDALKKQIAMLDKGSIQMAKLSSSLNHTVRK